MPKDIPQVGPLLWGLITKAVEKSGLGLLWLGHTAQANLAVRCRRRDDILRVCESIRVLMFSTLLIPTLTNADSSSRSVPCIHALKTRVESNNWIGGPSPLQHRGRSRATTLGISP